LRFDVAGAAGYALLGIVAALVGGFVPARAAQRIAPAQALKGLGMPATSRSPWRAGVAMLIAGARSRRCRRVRDSLAAYFAVALLLVGGIACVPAASAPRSPSSARRAARSPCSRSSALAISARARPSPSPASSRASRSRSR
jgi:putative ABC transport system permease protein